MGIKQIVISGKELIRILQKSGFVVTKVRGSHHILKHVDGRKTTIPVHKDEDLPKGLLRKIIKEDLQTNFEDFYKLIKKTD